MNPDCHFRIFNYLESIEQKGTGSKYNRSKFVMEFDRWDEILNLLPFFTNQNIVIYFTARISISVFLSTKNACWLKPDWESPRSKQESHCALVIFLWHIVGHKHGIVEFSRMIFGGSLEGHDINIAFSFNSLEKGTTETNFRQRPLIMLAIEGRIPIPVGGHLEESVFRTSLSLFRCGTILAFILKAHHLFILLRKIHDLL